MQARDLHAHRQAQLRVEVRQRLVEQEHLRLAHQRATERDALALAAGQRARLALAASRRGRASAPPRRRGASISSRGDAAQLQAEGEVLGHASCADTARSSGTPSRCRDPSARTSLTTRSPIDSVPDVTDSRPAIMRSVVVLPQPDGPTSTSSSPSRASNVAPCDGDVPVRVDLAHVVELDVGHRQPRDFGADAPHFHYAAMRLSIGGRFGYSAM